MKIKYLDGHRLARAIIAGSKRIFEKTNHLNEINFFPVPDSDTGSNISSTFHAIVSALQSKNSHSVKKTCHTIANAALLGAHGNSGIIFAQFFYGIYNEMDNRWKVPTQEFGKATNKSVKYVYEALSDPQEGTILSVIRDWSDAIHDYSYNTDDFVELWEHGIQVAKDSLENTRNKIENKTHNVVDAGAQGFVYFLEGIHKFISQGAIAEVQSHAENLPEINNEFDEHSVESLKEIKYRYCTEFLVKGSELHNGKIKNTLQKYGSSIVLAGSDELARYHVHTNQPHNILNELKEFGGKITEQKVDDIKQEYIDNQKEHTNIAIVTDSASNLPQKIIDRFNIHVIPFNINFGEETYLDGLTISQSQFYNKMNSEKKLVSTSQPSPSFYKETYTSLLNNYDKIISIHISDLISGAYQAARSLAKQYEDKIEVIDTKTLTVTQGMLVIKAAQMAEEGANFPRIVQKIKSQRKATKLFVSISDFNHLMKSGRVKKAKGFLGKLLNVNPILTIDSKGEIIKIDQAYTKNSATEKVIQKVKDFLSDKNNPKFFIVHAQDKETAQKYANFVQEYFNVNNVEIVPAAPVLAAHAGIGTAGIGIMWEE